jgi:glycolate oxidase FAD binding subunit
VSTESIAAAIAEAAKTRTPLRIVGRSTWLDAGRPVRAEKNLSLRDDAGIVSYVPGDLTLTVRGGTTLSEIEKATREHEQWLPLDPYGSPDGTIGATLATASAGPLSSSFGLPRDLLLGVEFVNGRGEVVRGGGKVVKNVAGFDLSRLITGSWGTLGVITEVTLRLYALPKVDRTFSVPLDGSPRETAMLLRGIIMSPLTPFALVLLNRGAARLVGAGDTPIGLIRFGGNDAMVRAQAAALAQITSPREADTGIWRRLGQFDDGAASVVRISTLPRRFVGLSAEILGDDVPETRTCIDPRRGVLRLAVGETGDAGEGVVPSAGPVVFSDSVETIFEKLRPDIWKDVAPSAVSDPLSQGIKKAYDPHNILNPGILGDPL